MAKDGTETPKAGGALSGVKVVDLSRVLGGPFATQLLAHECSQGLDDDFVYTTDTGIPTWEHDAAS